MAKDTRYEHDELLVVDRYAKHDKNIVHCNVLQTYNIGMDGPRNCSVWHYLTSHKKNLIVIVQYNQSNMSTISTLVGEELEGGRVECSGILAAPNGSAYGIPNFRNGRVVKFNPIDKSITHIGPDLSRVQGL